MKIFRKVVILDLGWIGQMEVSQAEKGRPTMQEKALQTGNCGQIGIAQESCSREGRVMMRLNRRAGARLEGSLHSK